MTQTQQYCLRWNNHQTNLLSVFEELLQNEAFTDVTLACEGGHSMKAHRMVLAACSPYFQNLFIDLPCKHPVVVLKDVKYTEIKAILEYMYRGEVNVAQNELGALLKVAEALKVKGLVEENRACKTEPANHSPSISTSNNSLLSNSVLNNNEATSSPPPHSTVNNSAMYANPYGSYERKNQQEHSGNGRINLPFWAMSALPPLPPHTAAMPSQSHPHTAATAAAMLNSAYEAVSSDLSPLKRKKLSSILMQRDTPILRTVLGQGQADSNQPVSLVYHADSAESKGDNNRVIKHIKNEPSEDAQSPYTDFTERMNDEEEKSKMAVPSSSPQSLSQEIAPYVPSQRPEWKRYKLYTKNDITSAIEAVKNGMSALQAARLYKVPSRTLYDKVKKMGITTSRPFRKGANGSTYATHILKNEESINNNSALLEATTYFQHALDSRGGDERETLAAMAAAAAVQAVAFGHSTSPNSVQARSPSPSPTMLKYMRQNSLTPSPAPSSGPDHHQHHHHHHHNTNTNGSSDRAGDDDDLEMQVEDLSVNKKPETIMESRVIMPPMNQISAIVKKKEEMLIDSIKDDMRQMRVGAESN